MKEADFSFFGAKMRVVHPLTLDFHVHKHYDTKPNICTNAARSCDASSPKTLRKWVWSLIEVLVELQY